MEEEIFDGCFSENYKCLLSGSSCTGKSTLIFKLMINKNRIYPHHYENIVYCHGVKTAALQNLKDYFGDKIEFYDHIPENLPQLCSRRKQNLLVLDDLDIEAFSNPMVASCFTKYSHHLGFNVLLSTQDIFAGGSGSKRLTLLRNCTHVILFKNYLDNTVPRLIAQKVVPGKTDLFMNIFERATTSPYGYLAIFGVGSRKLRFRTDITCPVQKIFVPEEDKP